MASQFSLTRRSFLTAAAGAVSAYALVACSQGSNDSIDASTDTAATFDGMTEADGNYSYNGAAAGVELHHSDILSPTYFIFAGQKDLAGANALIDELGLAQNLEDWCGNAYVVNPADGKAYANADAEAFVELAAATGPANNVKVIGVEEGADFVLGALAPKLYFVAGVMTYGGTSGDAAGVPFVPAYLVGASQAAVDAFVAANDAVEVATGTYENAEDSLKTVVVGEDKDLASAFASAWEKVFSKNYRQHNEQTEFYMASPLTHTDPYLLYTIPTFDPEAVSYVEHYNEAVDGLEGEYTWFEYVPEQVANAADGTVPLVVSLHGNLNDSRCQIDASGWAELAVEEGFIVAAPEWQDVVYESGSDEPLPNFFECDGLQDDRIVTWVEMLKATYPQIDEHRIYVTGLSAGCSASELYGVKYADVFAAVGGVSGPGIDKEEIAKLANNWDGPEVPWVYFCGDHDFFGMIPVDLSSKNAFPVDENGTTIAQVDPRVPIFPLIQSYLKVNGLDVPEDMDLTKNEWFGIEFDETNEIMLGKKKAQENVLFNKGGQAIVKMVAIYDQAHWNWKPEAAYLWEFFKGFSR